MKLGALHYTYIITLDKYQLNVIYKRYCETSINFIHFRVQSTYSIDEKSNHSLRFYINFSLSIFLTTKKANFSDDQKK